MKIQSSPFIVQASAAAAAKRAAAAQRAAAAAAAKKAAIEGWTFIATVLLFCGAWLFLCM
jgi:hypothetical protein